MSGHPKKPIDETFPLSEGYAIELPISVSTPLYFECPACGYKQPSDMKLEGDKKYYRVEVYIRSTHYSREWHDTSHTHCKACRRYVVLQWYFRPRC